MADNQYTPERDPSVREGLREKNDPGSSVAGMRVLAFPKRRFRATEPFYALLAENLEAQGIIVDEFSPRLCVLKTYDVLHLHHPEKFVGSQLNFRAILRITTFFLLIGLQKVRGCRIVWSAHNEGPHEPGHPTLEWLYGKVFPSLVDGVIYLSEASREIIAKRWPKLSIRSGFVVPHGHFRGEYTNRIGQAEARERFGFNSKHRVIAFVGSVRPYKGAVDLIKAFVALPDSNLRLVVAGKILTPELKKEMTEILAGDARVLMIDEIIEPDQLQFYLNAADLMVLPFKRILNSGSAILALSFNRPVLTADLGSLKELQAIVGKEWIRLFKGALTPSILREAVEEFLQQPRSPIAPLECLDWAQIGRETASVYLSCCRRQ